MCDPRLGEIKAKDILGQLVKFEYRPWIRLYQC